MCQRACGLVSNPPFSYSQSTAWGYNTSLHCYTFKKMYTYTHMYKIATIITTINCIHYHNATMIINVTVTRPLLFVRFPCVINLFIWFAPRNFLSTQQFWQQPFWPSHPSHTTKHEFIHLNINIGENLRISSMACCFAAESWKFSFLLSPIIQCHYVCCHPLWDQKKAILFLDAISTITKTGTENSTEYWILYEQWNFIRIFQCSSENFTVWNHAPCINCVQGISRNRS